MKTITLKVPEEVDEQIRYQAEREGTSKSSIVREALAAYLGNDQKQDRPKSVYEGMKHLIGTLDGPRDLSTNPKYMEGFGQDSMGKK